MSAPAAAHMGALASAGRRGHASTAPLEALPTLWEPKEGRQNPRCASWKGSPFPQSPTLAGRPARAVPAKSVKWMQTAGEEKE